MPSEKHIRKSGIEILRFIGIFMVVSIHATGLIQDISVNQIGRIATKWVNTYGNLGVSIFIIISGYFGVKRDWRKMLRLELKVIFYSVCASILMRLIWPLDYPRSVILPLLERSVMPVVTKNTGTTAVICVCCYLRLILT